MNDFEKSLENKSTPRVLIVSLVFFLIGVAIMLIVTYLHHELAKTCVANYFYLSESVNGEQKINLNNYEKLKQCMTEGVSVLTIFFSHIGALFLVVSTWHAISEWFVIKKQKEDIEEITSKIDKKLDLMIDVSSKSKFDPYVDLIHIESNSADWDVGNLIKTSPNFIATLGGSNSWIRKNETAFEVRHKINKLPAAKIVIVDPESDAIKLIANKRGHESSRVKKEIQDMAQILINSGCEVYFNKLIPHHFLIVTEKQAHLSCYSFHTATAFNPVFVFEDNRGMQSYFNDLKADIGIFIKEENRYIP